MAHQTLRRVTTPALRKCLEDHLQDMQGAAYIAESLISVIVACGGNPNRAAIAIQAAEAALDVLKEIGRGLDSVEIEKVLS